MIEINEVEFLKEIRVGQINIKKMICMVI